MEKKKRGGARPGAGRPRSATPRGYLTLSVPLTVIDKAKCMRRTGVKVNEMVAEFISQKFDEADALV